MLQMWIESWLVCSKATLQTASNNTLTVMERFTIQNTESEYAWFFTADILAHSKRKN